MSVVVAISDAHVDWITYGCPRIGDIENAMHRSVDVAIERKADLWVFNGDWCNGDSGPRVFACMGLAIEIAMRLSDEGIPNLWLPGNHDVIEDGSGETTLSVLRALNTSASLHHHTHVLEQPRSFFVGGIWVHALPFTATSHPYDPEAYVRSIEAPRGSDFAQRSHLVLSHLTRIEGVTPGEEETEMSRGRQIVLPRRAIGERFFQLGARTPLILQGHIHKRQLLASDDALMPPVQIVGSAAQLTHGEEDHDPGFLVVDLAA